MCLMQNKCTKYRSDEGGSDWNVTVYQYELEQEIILYIFTQIYTYVNAKRVLSDQDCR